MIHLNIGTRLKGDTRYTLIRFESKDYIRGKGRKLSVSLHPYAWYFKRVDQGFRLTIAGLNIHYKRA